MDYALCTEEVKTILTLSKRAAVRNRLHYGPKRVRPLGEWTDPVSPRAVMAVVLDYSIGAGAWLAREGAEKPAAHLFGVSNKHNVTEEESAEMRHARFTDDVRAIFKQAVTERDRAGMRWVSESHLTIALVRHLLAGLIEAEASEDDPERQLFERFLASYQERPHRLLEGDLFKISSSKRTRLGFDDLDLYEQQALICLYGLHGKKPWSISRIGTWFGTSREATQSLIEDAERKVARAVLQKAGTAA